MSDSSVASLGALRRVPVAVNEPIRSYAPGTPERAALKARLLPLVGEQRAESALGAFRGLPACGTPEQIVPVTDSPVPLPVLPESWPSFWRHGQWNELRARIVGAALPTITTWINGVRIMEWTETEARHPRTGGIALQVHGGGDLTRQFVRYRAIRVKVLN